MELIFEKHIKKYVNATQSEIEQFYDLFTLRKLKKKEFLLQKDDICSFKAFITKGLLRIFHIDINGGEQVLAFGIEDWWIGDFDSFYNLKPSDLYIQALEDSEVLLLSRENEAFANEHFPFSEKLFHKLLIKSHIALQRRVIDNMSKPAEERYFDFIKKYPQMAGRLTNIQVAAYLGLTPEFLSKIRGKLAKG